MIVISSLFLVQCGGKKGKGREDNRTVFRYNESAGLNTLDPIRVHNFEDFLVIEQLFDGLISLDKDFNVVPAIAESWEISEDEMEYTFHLRKNVKFHPHEAFQDDSQRNITSKDVIYSFLRVIDPNSASPGKPIFQNLDRGERSDFRGIVAVDDYTVKIVLKEPQPALIYQLSLPYCSVVPSEVVEEYGPDFGLHPVGSGPFMFKSWRPEVKLVMIKNQEYYMKDEEGVQLPYLDAVSVSFLQDRHQEYIKFKTGELEMISGLNESDKDELLTPMGKLKDELADDFRLQKTPWLNTDYLGVLVDERLPIVKQSPLKQKLVRQAVAYAIDRKEFVRFLRNNVGAPAEFGFIPLGMPDFDQYSIQGYTYDIEKSKTLLAQAGYPGGLGAPDITLVSTQEYRMMCEYMQKTLSEIGLKVRIDLMSTSSMNSRIAMFETNFYRKSWIADYPDPINYFQLFYGKNFYPENGLNYSHFSNIQYDELYERARKEKEDYLRFDLYRRMQEIIHDEAPVIPLFYAETLRFLSNRVKGLEGNALNQLSLTRVKLN